MTTGMNWFLLQVSMVVVVYTAQASGAAMRRHLLTSASNCYDTPLSKVRRITAPGIPVFTIPLRRFGKYPEFIRVSVDEVYDGAYKISAITPGGRVLSDATFATRGEMYFDPRFVVSKVKVTYMENVIPITAESLPRIRISVYGCYENIANVEVQQTTVE